MNGTHTSKKKRDVPHIKVIPGLIDGIKFYLYACDHNGKSVVGGSYKQARDNFRRSYGY